MVPLGLVCGEKKSSKMAGKDRQTHPNAEMRPDLECACTHMHGVLEGGGRWWWALNGCTNQLEGWPLGPVVGQTALGAGMAGTDGWVQMQCDLARDGGGHMCHGPTSLPLLSPPLTPSHPHC